MKPVYQKLLYERDGRGDCLRCAVASLFELDYDKVPAFEDMDENNWWGHYCHYINSLGFYVIFNTVPENARPNPDCIYIANGKSARGVLHSVVYEGNKMIHDPHPSGNGIKRVESYELFVAKKPEKQKFRFLDIVAIHDEAEKRYGSEEGILTKEAKAFIDGCSFITPRI